MKQYTDFIIVHTDNLDYYGVTAQDIEHENGTDTLKSVCDPTTMKQIVSHWRDNDIRVKTVTILKDNDPNNMWIKVPKKELEKLGILSKLKETKENNGTLFLYGDDCNLYYETMRNEKPTEFKNRVFNSKRKSKVFSYKDYSFDGLAGTSKTDTPSEKPSDSSNAAALLAGKMAKLVRQLVGGREFVLGSYVPEASVSQAAEIYTQLRGVVDAYDDCIRTETINNRR